MFCYTVLINTQVNFNTILSLVIFQTNSFLAASCLECLGMLHKQKVILEQQRSLVKTTDGIESINIVSKSKSA